MSKQLIKLFGVLLALLFILPAVAVVAPPGAGKLSWDSYSFFFKWFYVCAIPGFVFTKKHFLTESLHAELVEFFNRRIISVLNIPFILLWGMFAQVVLGDIAPWFGFVIAGAGAILGLVTVIYIMPRNARKHRQEARQTMDKYAEQEL